MSGPASVCIREAVPADAEALARVHVDSWRWAYQGIVPDDVLASLSWPQRRDDWRERLAPGGDATMRTWVACGAAGPGPATPTDPVVGFASFGPGRDDERGPEVAELYAVYLARAWAGRGVGTALVRTGVRELPARFTVLDVWVLQDNADALAFYAACGLLPDGTSTTLEMGGVPLVELRCSGARELVERRLDG